MADEKELLYDVAGGVATLTLNRPEQRNALNGELLGQLVEAMKTARDDDAVKAVVLTGAGDKVFCAGADLGGFAADAALVEKHFASDLFLEFFRIMPRLGKPSLCAANGHVLAGGMGLALSCDLVIAKEGARFGTPEINVGAFPYMIMSIIYRNVPRKKVNEMMLLGEQISAEDAVTFGLANKVVPADEFQSAVDDWAAKLASKSPVLMRLGHDAMYRQQDMALDDALEFLRSQLSLTFSTEDIQEGVRGVLRQARTELEGQMTLQDKTQELHERREAAKLGGGEEKIAKQHERGKLTARERLDLLCDEGTFVEMGIHGRPHFSQRSMEGKEAAADGVITGWGDVDGRPCCIAAYDFTVMAGAMGMTGELKVTRLREMALSKRMPFIWLLDSAGARIQEASGSLFAGSGHLFQEEVVMSGRDPAGRGDDGPLRRGHGLHPRALGLRPDGLRPGRDGARRPAPDQGSDGRGHLDGGARRCQGPLPQVRCRRPRGPR